MSRTNGRDYIFLIWKDYKTRQRFVIGELSKNGKYQFKYKINDVNKAIKNGFELLIAFPNINKIYENHDVFPAFSSRLPDKRRKDIKEILAKYKLEKYDAFELLKKSGGKLPTDSLEFIDPIFLDDKNIEREFYIASVRHYDCFNKTDKYAESDLNIGENLFLVKDLNNIYDKYAIKITNKQNRLIGYIPVFFSKSVYKAINENRKIKCTIINKEFNDSCEDCVKVKLTII